MNRDLRQYEHYESIKGWDDADFMSPDAGERLFYDHYLGDMDLAGAPVVEIGFGNGNFLGWARSNGAIVYGSEVQDALVAKGRSNGVNILPVDIAQAAPALRGTVAVLAAIDVLEHLTRAEILTLLGTAAEILRPGGRLFLRFPNGQSPLSLPIQYGDATHVSTLSIPILQQLCAGLPFDLQYAGEPFRTLTGGVTSRLVRHVQGGIRRVVDRLFALVYGSMPLYPNAVVMMRRI